MQINASEFTELNMNELKKKNEMILVVFLDWHYREKRFHTNPNIFKSAFIYIFHMNRPSVWYSVYARNQCILSPKH